MFFAHYYKRLFIQTTPEELLVSGDISDNEYDDEIYSPEFSEESPLHTLEYMEDKGKYNIENINMPIDFAKKITKNYSYNPNITVEDVIEALQKYPRYRKFYEDSWFIGFENFVSIFGIKSAEEAPMLFSSHYLTTIEVVKKYPNFPWVFEEMAKYNPNITMEVVKNNPDIPLLPYFFCINPNITAEEYMKVDPNFSFTKIPFHENVNFPEYRVDRDDQGYPLNLTQIQERKFQDFFFRKFMDNFY